MERLAQKIINDHKNPLVKVELSGQKLFLKENTASEKQNVEQHQNALEKLLCHDRVERRCGRCQAIWEPKERRGRVLKVVKTLLKNFGHQDKSGIFLFPEEILFLLETNRLEILHNDVPLSVQEFYGIVTNTPNYSVIKYRVYKKLLLQGYRLVRKDEMDRRLAKVLTETDKRLADEVLDCPQPAKKAKASTKDESKTMFSDIFEKIRQTAPRPLKMNISPKQPDYLVFQPLNSSRTRHDLNLYIRFSIDSIILDLDPTNDHIPNIFALCTNENIAFYKFCNIILPEIN